MTAATLIYACTLGPPPGTVLGGGAVASPPSPAAENASKREEYIAHALTPSVPKGLEGRRLYGQGTGFFVTPTKVLTNFHVAGDCAVVTVGNASDAAEQIAQPVAKDAGIDLELLSVDAPTEAARFEINPASESGKNLAVVGYPEHGMTVRQAELVPADALPRDLVSGAARFPFNGAVRRGNSGGPLLDDTGAVLGVVVMKVDTVAVYQRTGEVVDKIGIAISNVTALSFLRVNGVSIQPAAPSEPLPPDRLLDKAHGFVRQIGCWR